MRAGLSTIHQTLTSEAAAVLNQSITEAGRRNHGQTTPLHVANILLGAPTGFLRQACIRSHPNSSHPLQCRALELCFSVALDRLPAATSAAAEPPISNALMAALKRAQAHQRRGCPEQQQQPLLAVKVELEQLIISILDDPSVSRVMREASFSSPAVKATIEQLLSNNNNNSNNGKNINPLTPAVTSSNSKQFFQLRNHQDDIQRVIDIMTKPKKKNPILVGESGHETGPETIRKEILKRVETSEFVINGKFDNIEVITIDKSLIPNKINELCDLIGKRVGNKAMIIDLGDLKWLVDQPGAAGRESVGEMAKLVAKLVGKIWLMGTATCETYLRCQVYHPSMETDWDLQAVPITTRSPLPNIFPRMGSNGIVGSPVQSVNPLNSLSTTKPPCCPECASGYEQELARLKELEKPLNEVVNNKNLPPWMQNVKPKDQFQKILEIQKKWRDECFRVHPNRMVVQPLLGAYKPNTLLGKSQRGQPPRLETPRSPVRTELVLGRNKTGGEDLTVKDLLGCISSEPRKGKFVNATDADYYKRLLKGLMKHAWWQPEAGSTIATAITQSKSETGSRGCVWLLFAGPDRVGKRKMASVISEHVTGTSPIVIGLGSRRDGEETDTGFRGKTVLDRIVDAVRRNPSSVIVLSDIDEADTLVRGSIKRAMERQRLTDSHGREISLGNVVFVLTGNWSTVNVDEHRVDEQRLQSLAKRDWRLRLTVGQKRLKRRADWLSGNDKSRRRKESGLDLCLDLNLAIDYEEDITDGSLNSSNLTVDHEEESQQFAVTSVPHELAGPSDVTVVFKPVNFENLRVEIEKTIRNTFSTVVNDNVTVEVAEGAVENILGGVWFGQTSLEDWVERVLVPSIDQVNTRLSSQREDMVVRVESDRVGGGGNDWLPSNIPVVVDH